MSYTYIAWGRGVIHRCLIHTLHGGGGGGQHLTYLIMGNIKKVLCQRFLVSPALWRLLEQLIMVNQPLIFIFTVTTHKITFF